MLLDPAVAPVDPCLCVGSLQFREAVAVFVVPVVREMLPVVREMLPVLLVSAPSARLLSRVRAPPRVLATPAPHAR
jgi:hypothetical protein